MVDEGLITREEAVARIDPGQLDQLLHPMIDPTATSRSRRAGLNASPGAACGAIVFDADTAEKRGLAGESVILVRWETTPDDIHGLIAGAGDPHRARRHDLARGGRRARDGEAVRRGLRGPVDRPGRAEGHDRRPRALRGRHDHDRRRRRRGDRRRGRPRPAADQRGLRDRARVGGHDAAAEGARERGHARRRGEGARVRRPGDRPLPDGAHVHGRGPPAGRPGDDHGLERRRAARRPRAAPAAPAERLRGHLRGDGRAPGHDPPARPAAARVPAAARPGDRRAHAREDPGAAGVEPDARHARLPARASSTRRSTRCRCAPSSAPRAAVEERTGDAPLVEIMHPARRLRRGAAPAAGDDSRDGARGEREGRVPGRDDDRAARARASGPTRSPSSPTSSRSARTT